MEELLKKIFSEDSTEYLDLIYENIENEGRILTKEFLNGLKPYKNKKKKVKENILYKLSKMFEMDDQKKQEIEKQLDFFEEVINHENGYYNRAYHKQGIKDGAKLFLEILDKKQKHNQVLYFFLFCKLFKYAIA